MASRYLVPGTTDLSDANAWAATRGGAGGETAPSAGDDVFILEGSQTINAGLTQLNVDLESLTIGADFTGNLGTAGSPATIGCHNSADATVKIQAGASSNIYITAGTAGIENLEVRMAGGEFRLTGGTTDDATFFSGRVFVEAAAVLSNAKIYGATVYGYTNGTAISTLYLGAGTCELDGRDITTGFVDGRSTRLKLTDDAAIGTNIYVHGGATYQHASDGTIAAAYLFDGTLTVSGAPANPTITALNLHSPRARAITKVGAVEATVTTLNDFADIGTESQPGIPNNFE